MGGDEVVTPKRVESGAIDAFRAALACEEEEMSLELSTAPNLDAHLLLGNDLIPLLGLNTHLHLPCSSLLVLLRQSIPCWLLATAQELEPGFNLDLLLL